MTPSHGLSHWISFFQTLCLHRQGYGMTLSYRDAVEHPGDVAGALHMMPLPTGHHTGLTIFAQEWRTTS